MKKMNVTYTRRDGKTPGLREGVIKVLAPFAITLNPGESRQFDLGVSFDHVLLVFENPSLARSQGVRLVDGMGVVHMGAPVLVGLKNDGKTAAVIESGDPLAHAVPFGGDFTLSEA